MSMKVLAAFDSSSEAMIWRYRAVTRTAPPAGSTSATQPALSVMLLAGPSLVLVLVLVRASRRPSWRTSMLAPRRWPSLRRTKQLRDVTVRAGSIALGTIQVNGLATSIRTAARVFEEADRSRRKAPMG